MYKTKREREKESELSVGSFKEGSAQHESRK